MIRSWNVFVASCGCGVHCAASRGILRHTNGVVQGVVAECVVQQLCKVRCPTSEMRLQGYPARDQASGSNLGRHIFTCLLPDSTDRLLTASVSPRDPTIWRKRRGKIATFRGRDHDATVWAASVLCNDFHRTFRVELAHLVQRTA